jgi:hypothetical protein
MKEYTYQKAKEEKEWIWSACQNCRRPVRIQLPFHGCVFCGECFTTSGTTDLYSRIKQAWK